MLLVEIIHFEVIAPMYFNYTWLHSRASVARVHSPVLDYHIVTISIPTIHHHYHIIISPPIIYHHH